MGNRTRRKNWIFEIYLALFAIKNRIIKLAESDGFCQRLKNEVQDRKKQKCLLKWRKISLTEAEPLFMS